jgi:hypothetical protein
MGLFDDRRSRAGGDLAQTLLDADQAPVPFDDLATRGEVADVAGWLGNAVEEGLVEDIPSGDGRRFFRLRRRGRTVLTRGRRADDAA